VTDGVISPSGPGIPEYEIYPCPPAALLKIYMPLSPSRVKMAFTPLVIL